MVEVHIRINFTNIYDECPVIPIVDLPDLQACKSSLPFMDDIYNKGGLIN